MTIEPPRYGEMRPRPQYGEYASPQVQAEAVADSHPPIAESLIGAASDDVTTAPPPDASARVGANLPASRPSATGPNVTGPNATGPNRDPRRPRRFDVILTAVLMGYAALNVITQLVRSSSLTGAVNQIYVTEGIGTYAPTANAATLGIILNFVTLLVFVVTVYLTIQRLRNGRLAFWIPLVGGAIVVVVSLVFVASLILADPTFTAWMNTHR